MDLSRLQLGQMPLCSRPMISIGSRVYEIKEQDERAWYRVVYLAKIEDRIHVLHCFEKQSGKTSPRDLNVAKLRLQGVLVRLLEESKDEKRRK